MKTQEMAQYSPVANVAMAVLAGAALGVVGNYSHLPVVMVLPVEVIVGVLVGLVLGKRFVTRLQ